MKKPLISILILILIPLFIGLPLMYAFENPVILEVIPIVFGLFELIVLISRVNRHDLHNKETLGTFKSDKTSLEYRDYIRIQNILFVSGAGNLLLSYLYFLILGA